MENLVEKPANYTVVFGDMAYNGKKKQIECPPATVNNKKKLPKHRVPMQEGEMSVGISKEIKAEYEKDENGKITSIRYLDKEEVPEMPKITGEFKGDIAENGEIIRDTADIDR